jgi:hypothetical protein
MCSSWKKTYFSAPSSFYYVLTHKFIQTNQTKQSFLVNIFFTLQSFSQVCAQIILQLVRNEVDNIKCSFIFNRTENLDDSKFRQLYVF